MPMWAYKGIGPSGKAVTGVRDADTPKLVRALLRKEGVVVTEVEASKQGGAGKAANAAKGGLSKEVDLGAILGGVKKTDVAAFTRQLATLLKAGVALAESLGTLFEQTDNVRLKVPIGEVRTMVNEGSSFADALARHPKIFDELYVSMVRAYNTWLAQDYCSVAPDRLIGLSNIPNYDMEESVAEAMRNATASNSSAGTTWFTKPNRLASSAPIQFPVREYSRAR